MVQCPFFKRTKKNSIACEGAFPGSNATTWFPTGAQRDAAMAEFCKDRYEACPLYRAAYAKYD